jgi:HK97 family phage portal protein
MSAQVETKSIWRQLYGSLNGGWKTYGPSAIEGSGAFDSGEDNPFGIVTSEAAMRLSAVRSCVALRSEVIGAMPLHLRDGKKNIVTDHPLYRVLHTSPNADMTAPEYWSLATAQTDMHGNHVSIIERGLQKKVVALTPVAPGAASFEYNKTGTRKKWKVGKDDFNDDDILHLRGFSMNAGWGDPVLDAGRQILRAQLMANDSAMRAFKQGLKVGGFFLNEGTRDLTGPELTAFQERLNFFGRPENAGKWMNLLKGMKPIAGTEFSVKPSDAQLLESRYFGIEEICRLFNIPPPLIGHTSKASSWASSIENLNMHFVVYSLQPTLVRNEASISKKLLTASDIAAGIQPKFAMQGLLRGDTKTRQLFYASGLQNGYLSQNDVLDLEDRPGIGPEGDVYRVQLNMANADQQAAAENDKPAKGNDQ